MAKVFTFALVAALTLGSCSCHEASTGIAARSLRGSVPEIATASSTTTTADDWHTVFGLFRIKNKATQKYLVWVNDYVFAFPITSDKKFEWELIKDAADPNQVYIFNHVSGRRLLAGSCGNLATDIFVYHTHNEAFGCKTGFSWTIRPDGGIQNVQSKKYLTVNPSKREGDHLIQQDGHVGKETGMDGFIWELEPVGDCGNNLAKGEWQRVGFSQKGFQMEETSGWSSTSSAASTKHWQATLGVSISAGFKAADVEISAEYSWGASSTYEQSSTEEKETSFSFEPEASGLLWRWEFHGNNRCGEGRLKTKALVVTTNAKRPPCCPPGGFMDPLEAHGACINEAICLCEPNACLMLHKYNCKDQYSQCKLWRQKGHCNATSADTAEGQWVRDHCRKSCDDGCQGADDR